MEAIKHLHPVEDRPFPAIFPSPAGVSLSAKITPAPAPPVAGQGTMPSQRKLFERLRQVTIPAEHLALGRFLLESGF